MARDAALVCTAGGLRAASVSLAGVLIAIHLSNRGLTPAGIGLVIAAGMAASAAGTVITGLRADAWGRRRTLIALHQLSIDAIWKAVDSLPAEKRDQMRQLVLRTRAFDTGPFIPMFLRQMTGMDAEFARIDLAFR